MLQQRIREILQLVAQAIGALLIRGCQTVPESGACKDALVVGTIALVGFYVISLCLEDAF